MRRSALVLIVASAWILGGGEAHAARRPSLAVAPLPSATRPAASTPTVRWNTGTGVPGEVTVTTADGTTRLVASGASGTSPAPWITPGARFTFVLSATAPQRRLLARLRIEVAGPAPVEVKPVLATPAPTSEAINISLIALPFVGAVALTGLAVATLRTRRRHA